MNHTLFLYDFNNNDIRVIEIDGEPRFAAKDVCDALSIKRYRNALDVTVSEANRVAVLKSSLLTTHTMGLSFPNRGMKCVNEAGLYELIFASRKPEALSFKNWVTSVVLPAIRKHSGYFAGEEKVATGEMDEEELIMLAMEAQARKVQRLRTENKSMRMVLETCSLQS